MVCTWPYDRLACSNRPLPYGESSRGGAQAATTIATFFCFSCCMPLSDTVVASCTSTTENSERLDFCHSVLFAALDDDALLHFVCLVSLRGGT